MVLGNIFGKMGLSTWEDGKRILWMELDNTAGVMGENILESGRMGCSMGMGFLNSMIMKLKEFGKME